MALFVIALERRQQQQGKHEMWAKRSTGCVLLCQLHAIAPQMTSLFLKGKKYMVISGTLFSADGLQPPLRFHSSDLATNDPDVFLRTLC